MGDNPPRADGGISRSRSASRLVHNAILPSVACSASRNSGSLAEADRSITGIAFFAVNAAMRVLYFRNDRDLSLSHSCTGSSTNMRPAPELLMSATSHQVPETGGCQSRLFRPVLLKTLKIPGPDIVERSGENPLGNPRSSQLGSVPPRWIYISQDKAHIPGEGDIDDPRHQGRSKGRPQSARAARI